MKASILACEPTSLSPTDGKLIEVAVVNFDLEVGDMVDAWSFLVSGATEEEINKTRHIHGISPVLVNQYGYGIEAVESGLRTATKDSKAFLAHNAEFDRQWLPFLPDLWCCTMDDIVWPKESPSKSLVAISLTHGLGVMSAHRAMDDCMTIARLLRRVGEKHYLPDLIKHGMRPKATFKALVSYEDRELAKKAGFRWEPDKKLWYRKMAIEDVGALGFKTVRMEEKN